MKKKEEIEMDPELESYQDEQLGKASTEKQGITLGQIGHMIWKHWVASVICLLVGLAAGVAYSKFIKTPKYQATVQVMVVSNDKSTTTDNINDAIAKARIVYGYMQFDEVAESVGKKLIEKGYGELYVKDANGKETAEIDLAKVKSYYTVAIPTVTTNSTSIFVSVTSTCKTEALAVDTANYVVTSTIELANDSSNTGAYSMLHNSIERMGTANSAKDTSTSTVVFALVGSLAGLVIGAGYGIVRELLNTKVSSKTDLEALTGYKVIGMIPKYGLPGGGESKEKGAKKDHE